MTEPAQIRVLIIDSQIKYGGGETYKLDVAHCLGEENFDFTFATPESSDFRSFINERNYKWVHFTPKSRLDISAMRSFAKEMKQHNFDIIFTSDSISWYTGVFLKKICLPKALFSIIHIATLGSGQNFSSLKRIVIGIVERYWTKFYTKVIASTEMHWEYLLEAGVPDERLTIIKNCVDKEKIIAQLSAEMKDKIRQQYEIKENNLVIGMLGRFGPGKDFETFVRSIPYILEKNKSCIFLLVGDGPDKETLEELVEKLEIRDFVRFTGFVKEGYYDIIDTIDIFVNSTYAEGVSYVVLDAMALGKPIVATDAGGIKEAVKNGESGLFAPIRDYKALAMQINKLIENPEMMDAFGKRAVELQKENYSYDQMSDLLNKLINESLGA